MPSRRPKTVRTETKRITEMLKAAGTYQPFFVDSIDHLARLYVELEAVQEEFDESEDRSVTITQVNKAGMEYTTLNPLLAAEYRILEQARYYEARLGLTPLDHRKIISAAPETQNTLGAKLRLLEAQ